MRPEAETFFKNRAEKLLILIGQELVNKAKLYCPVGKYTDGRVGGRLRGSITFATSTTQSEIKSAGNPATNLFDAIKKPEEDLTVRVGSAVEYAPFVEFGTARQGNTPFLRTALCTANIKGLIKRAGYK